VGVAVNSQGHARAFLWTDTNTNNASDPGEMVDLGTLGGDISTAYGINESGIIVGESETTGGAFHAFLYRDGAMTNLNDLLDSEPDWTLDNAWAISDTGHIVGHGTHEIYSDQAYLLYIPEPMCSPFIILSSAVFVLLIFYRRVLVQRLFRQAI